MAGSVKELLAAANAAVPKITAAEARRMAESEGAVIVDVRDGTELSANGKIPGSLHVPRGMLEFRADPESPFYNNAFAKGQTYIMHCASGGRAALAGKVLKDFGYDKVFNLGGFKDWVEAGGPVEKPLDKGM